MILREDNLEVYLRDQVINVSVLDITNIVSGLNDFINLKGKMSMMYRIDLKTKYKFGTKLYFRFEEHLDQNVDPKEMSKIKEIIEDKK